MICLECQDNIYGLQPGKLACLPKKTLNYKFGPEKGGNLHPSLKIFCPEGHSYLPLDGEVCQPCKKLNCSRCQMEDLTKCEGCQSGDFTRKDGQGSCTTQICNSNEYFTKAEGHKCVLFSLPNCLQKDSFGWCDTATGCPPTKSYSSGVCCTETPL